MQFKIRAEYLINRLIELSVGTEPSGLEKRGCGGGADFLRFGWHGCHARGGGPLHIEPGKPPGGRFMACTVVLNLCLGTGSSTDEISGVLQN